MNLEHGIYCIEGQWNWGKKEVEPSVEPILQMLQKMGQWDYARRDCATYGEMQFWLKHEWAKLYAGSILYISSHGEGGRIWLTNEENNNNSVSLHQLADGGLSCEYSLVHFGGCSVLAKEAEGIVRTFMEKTKATYVTGYGVEVGWADRLLPPAVALEFMLFSSIWKEEIDLSEDRSNGRSRKKLKELIDGLNENDIFGQCKLKLYTKWDTEGD